jgi:hypothetical protein
VQDQRVDASGAVFFGGTAADLANGRLVRVAGTLSGGTVIAAGVAFLR